MKKSIVILITGVWLILSGIIPVLQSPINLILVGSFMAVCCFLSQKTWQILTIGIIGLWLFLSGMISVLGSAAVSLVASLNFLIIGMLLMLLGVVFYLKASRQAEVKVYTI
ncbi:MAG: hypothetical protein WAN36_09550 [Calditrichia bacterium]